MKIIDISMNIHQDMMVYKNRDENRPELKFSKRICDDGINESWLKIYLHSGTHIDASFHVDDNGETIEYVDLKKLATECKVLDLTKIKAMVTKNDLLDKEIKEGDFIILKTINSYKDEFDYEFVFLEKSGAQYLKSKGVIGVGIDALGIERSQLGHDTHKILLGSNIVILEGLRLRDVDEGKYFLFALPLKINGADGSPARAILIKND